MVKAESAKQEDGHTDDVCITLGAWIAVQFGVYLMKLSETTLLRAFMSKHGADTV